MVRLIILSIMLQTALCAYTYNELVLKAQSAIFPKIILLSQNLEEMLVDGEIVYTILYTSDDRESALDLKSSLDDLYDGHINNHKFKVKTLDYDKLSTDINTTAVYALNSEDGITTLLDILKDRDILTFAYDLVNLKRGLLFSLVLEKSTVIYLHRDVLQSSGFKFPDSLYRIVQFY